MLNQLGTIVAVISFWVLTLFCGIAAWVNWEYVNNYSRVFSIALFIIMVFQSIHYSTHATSEDLGV